jgi:hypothetical protein
MQPLLDKPQILQIMVFRLTSIPHISQDLKLPLLKLLALPQLMVLTQLLHKVDTILNPLLMLPIMANRPQLVELTILQQAARLAHPLHPASRPQMLDQTMEQLLDKPQTQLLHQVDLILTTLHPLRMVSTVANRPIPLVLTILQLMARLLKPPLLLASNMLQLELI